ncbi:MAG: MFS transporter [Trueperaceae bacterium]|nr:MFS transporter [Trueperaceae bacterium]MCO5174443.1 MFS transporter [Trueperaceae bacterium]
MEDAALGTAGLEAGATLAADAARKGDVGARAAAAATTGTVFTVIAAISFSHFLNDLMQALLPAIYPMLKDDHALTFAQVGLLTLTFQFTASLLQPVVGIVADRRPLPYSMAVGMASTLAGLLLLAKATSFPLLVLAAALVGLGSSVFHPEASRVARMAAGGRPGLAQSLFQVGGNFGSALGPLLAAFIVLPFGQGSIAWFSVVAVLAMVVLFRVGKWYASHVGFLYGQGRRATAVASQKRIVAAVLILIGLTFSKAVYGSSLSSYYTFFLIERFGVSIRDSQLLLFVYMVAVVIGTIIGGPLGDRFGRKLVLWGSVLGALPFTLLLPWVNLTWTLILTALIGIIMASAFPAIVVYAQELLPRGVGMVAGLLYGLSFGVAGVAAAFLGGLADTHGIAFVYQLCGWLPVVGLLVVFLPDARTVRET